MSLTTELEKLITLRDRGELSSEEFEKAKAVVLSGEAGEAGEAGGEGAPPALPVGEKKGGVALLVAVLLSVTVLMSGVSLGINPSPLKGAIFGLWVVAASCAWVGYAKGEKTKG